MSVALVTGARALERGGSDRPRGGRARTDLDPDRQALAAGTPVGRLGDSEEVADMVAAVVHNGYMTGQSIVLDGGRHPT